jgi:hypothetical protein
VLCCGGGGGGGARREEYKQLHWLIKQYVSWKTQRRITIVLQAKNIIR